MKDPAVPRREYFHAGLSESDLDPDPVVQFARWFRDAHSGGPLLSRLVRRVQTAVAGPLETNAMTLATVAADGSPRARMVLLKDFDARGFVFYTNYESGKGRELAAEPRAALVFFWKELARQVRITGRMEKTSRAESATYFSSRPRGSQLGAAVSAQSEILPGRAPLEARLAELTREYAGRDIPCPPHWGGYRLTPDSLEFWQGRLDRLHDRLRYRREGESWIIERLSP